MSSYNSTAAPVSSLDVRRRLWTIVGLAAVLWVVHVASAFSATLTGLTTLEGLTHAGYVPVTLGSPVSLDLSDPSQLFTIEGGDQVAGLALRSDSDAAPGAFLLFVQRAGGAQGEYTIVVARHGVPDPDPQRLDISPGAYRLYAFGDRATPRVSLRLPGLIGSTVLRTTVALDANIGPLARVDPFAGTGVFAWGATNPLRSAGVLLGRLVLRGSGSALARIEFCLHPGGPSQDAATAFGPGCGSADAQRPYETQTIGTPVALDAGFVVLEAPPGVYGLGVNAQAAGSAPPETADAMGLWMPFNGAQGAPVVETPAPPKTGPRVAQGCRRAKMAEQRALKRLRKTSRRSRARAQRRRAYLRAHRTRLRLCRR